MNLHYEMKLNIHECFIRTGLHNVVLTIIMVGSPGELNEELVT